MDLPETPRIATLQDIETGLDALCRLDPRLTAVRTMAGEVPLRRVPPGFASLVAIILSQQISRASADAILSRLVRQMGEPTPEAMLAAEDSVHRQAGLSRPKQKALVAAARAVADGLDLDALCKLGADEAIRRLTMVPGIGPWTAEVYLLTAAGHPDIFPSRDVALQTAVGHALAMERRPTGAELHLIAESWSPWRGVASRLFWSYYRSTRGREGIPSSLA